MQQALSKPGLWIRVTKLPMKLPLSCLNTCRTWNLESWMQGQWTTQVNNTLSSTPLAPCWALVCCDSCIHLLSIQVWNCYAVVGSRPCYFKLLMWVPESTALEFTWMYICGQDKKLINCCVSSSPMSPGRRTRTFQSNNTRLKGVTATWLSPDISGGHWVFHQTHLACRWWLQGDWSLSVEVVPGDESGKTVLLR